MLARGAQRSGARSSADHVLSVRSKLVRRLELGFRNELGHKVRRVSLITHMPDLALAGAHPLQEA